FPSILPFAARPAETLPDVREQMASVQYRTARLDASHVRISRIRLPEPRWHYEASTNTGIISTARIKLLTGIGVCLVSAPPQGSCVKASDSFRDGARWTSWRKPYHAGSKLTRERAMPSSEVVGSIRTVIEWAALTIEILGASLIVAGVSRHGNPSVWLF